MMNPEITAIIVGQRSRDIATAAAQRRLAAIATCCRPSYVAAKLAALREHLVRHRSTTAACC